jgi:branched-chain amino acid transport system substrate-binding protein
VHTLAAIANREKSLDAKKLAEALGGFELADDVKLQPYKSYYRKGDHQLMTTAFVGEALSKPAGDPEDLFRVDSVVPGDKTAPPENATGCTLKWPA